MDAENDAALERIGLKPVAMPGDDEFLSALYYATRDDPDGLPIDENQKKSLCLMQYVAQKQQFESTFPNSEHDLVVLGEQKIGRLWTARTETEIVCVDISILPEFRNCGTGTFLLNRLIGETARTGRVFNLHVRRLNEKALRLYRRLNFRVIAETATHYKMQWKLSDDILRSAKNEPTAGKR